MDPKSKAPIKKSLFVLIVILGLAGCGGPHIRFLNKKLPPRSEPPIVVSSDPVFHGLEGWEQFGAFEIKGTLDDLIKGDLKKDIIKEAATLGAEGFDYSSTTISRKGGEMRTLQYTEKYGSTKVEHYRIDRLPPTFSKGFYVALYQRTRPNALYAFENLCGEYHDGTEYRESVCDFKTLKNILELSAVDVNHQRKGLQEKETTLLAKVVEKIADETDYRKAGKYTRKRVADKLQMVSLLISKGANPNIVTDINTPLPPSKK